MTKTPAAPIFQSLLAAAILPPPGPEHFAARRALWVTPTTTSRLTRIKQDDKPGVLESPEVSGTTILPLCTVVCLRTSLSLLFLVVTIAFQIKIVHAGWRQDGTWPDNATVVDEDNFFGTMDSHGIEPSANGSRKSEGG